MGGINVDVAFSKRLFTNEIAHLVASLITPEASVLENYIIPGLRSTQLGTATHGGMIRLFEMEREQEVEIVPHDHRYDFECFVLEGQVENKRYRIWTPEAFETPKWARFNYIRETRSLDYSIATLYDGETKLERYGPGEWYGMKAEQFHSIRFTEGTRVLFLEGPKPAVERTTSMLVPHHGGRICDTHYWREWMMQPPQGAP